MKRAYIKGIDYHVPELFEKNSESDRITRKVGILKRPIANCDEYASDLAIAAAKKMLTKQNIDISTIDMLIYCTQSPDYILPTTACILQDALGLSTRCAAFDINLGCSGYVYGLSVAKAFIESGMANNILFLTSDTYSKYINPKDRSVRVLFGDGASATLVSGKESDRELIGPFVFGTDGTGKDNLIIKSGGLKEPITKQSEIEEEDSFGNIRSNRNLYMNGSEIFNFTLREIPLAVTKLLSISGMKIKDYNRFVFHQANKFMLENLRKILDISEERFSLNLENYGNTVSSSIPISLCKDLENKKASKEDTAMLVGFGVGYSWAACNIIL
ncbi:beta-ketoacyl-ACP synthase 3 [Paenibacillus sp. HJL G12]|uniref:Beta-ketoacyl-ACP synthase 3 n=1 Tax=Paenibacillus dendrobii TaxID=2691084 RepID=A0A7X3IQY0_9BACL|nr:ketoacyl-ACP synthase III [Paenibacillus dendrobii]MWV46622.1 beta-ketoacyl-ACP synthase 3 [Paenibacillus dendrobii]